MISPLAFIATGKRQWKEGGISLNLNSKLDIHLILWLLLKFCVSLPQSVSPSFTKTEFLLSSSILFISFPVFFPPVLCDREKL